MITTLWLLACHGPSKDDGTDTDAEPAGDTAAPTGSDTATGTDTRHDSGYTAPPCYPVEEVIRDGIDEDCDGYGDELGFGGSVLAIASDVLAGSPARNIGSVIDIGTNEGQGWLLTGAAYGAGEALPGIFADAAPVDGQFELQVDGQSYSHAGQGIAVVDWPGEPFVSSSDDFDTLLTTHGGTGVQQLEADAVSVNTRFEPYLAVSSADLDEDGAQDLLLGEPWGVVLVLEGPPPPGDWEAEEPRFEADGAGIGYFVGDVGDLTGDGLPEITFFAENDIVGGQVWVFPGNLEGVYAAPDVGWTVDGIIPGGQVGYDNAIGDVNGDGYQDLVAGANVPNDRAGITYVMLGPITATTTVASAAAEVDGLAPLEWCGSEVHALPDGDGDGADEVAIGCPSWGLPGRVEVYSGATMTGVLTAPDADAVWIGAHTGDGFGTAMATGDVTGDAVVDLVVGAPGDSSVNPAGGAIYVLQSPWW